MTKPENNVTGTKTRRPRQPTEFALVHITETANDIDPITNEEIPGTARRCYVQMPLPKGAEDLTSRAAIERAVYKEVYTNNNADYGNKDLAVIIVGPTFHNDCEPETTTRLVHKKDKKR